MTRINAMAVDIGGTKIALCAINPEGEITANPETYPIPFDENKVARIVEIQHIIASKAVELVNEGILVSGIGVSICGSVDPIDDRVLLVPNHCFLSRFQTPVWEHYTHKYFYKTFPNRGLGTNGELWYLNDCINLSNFNNMASFTREVKNI